MTDSVKSVKSAFSEKTITKAAQVGAGIGIAELIDYGIKKIGKTNKIPDGVGGLATAAVAAIAKQPAVTVGGLADTLIVGVRTVTGYDITKPAEQIQNMQTNNTDELVI